MIDILAYTNKEKYRNAFSVCLSSEEGGYLTIGGQDRRYINKSNTPIVVKFTNLGQYYIGLHGLTVTKVLKIVFK